MDGSKSRNEEAGTAWMAELTEVFGERRKQWVRFAYSYVRDREAAEDIVMNAFACVWERRNELQKDTNIPALLLTAIKNGSLNHLKRLEVRMRAEQHVGEMRRRELALRISTLEACNPEQVFCDEIQKLMQETLSELPPTSREVFVLSRIENRPNKEIALYLDLSVKTVEFHITRSLKQLRAKLKDYRPGGMR